MSSLRSCRRYLYVWLVFAAVGVILGSLFRSSYFDDLKQINDSFFNNLTNYPIYIGKQENIFLLFKIICKRFAPFLLMWMLEYTYFNAPYIMWFCASRGFFTGFFVCFITMCYKLQAFKIIAGMVFPQMIFYTLVYILSIICVTEGLKRRKKTVMILLAVMLLTGCITETFLNPKFLGWVM